MIETALDLEPEGQREENVVVQIFLKEGKGMRTLTTVSMLDTFGSYSAPFTAPGEVVIATVISNLMCLVFPI